MTEPRRLREQGATEAERALLDSARADAPSKGAAQRMMIALDGLTAGSSGAGAPIAAQALKLGALAKVGLVALVGVGALGAGVLVYLVAGQRSLSGEKSGASAPLTRESPVASGEPGSSAVAKPSPLPTAASQANAPLPAPAAAPRHRPANATDESLSSEIRILDVARAAVDARNPAAAQRALDNYAQRFPQGNLKPEATVLRLAVLVRQGNRAAAKALAAQLLANDSYNAYAYRIRSLLREAGD